MLINQYPRCLLKLVGALGEVRISSERTAGRLSEEAHQCDRQESQIKLYTVADLHHGPKLRKAGSLDEELKTPAAFSLLDGTNPLTHGHVHNYGFHLNLSCRLIIFAWVSP